MTQKLEVWAPRASSVEVELVNNRMRLPMLPRPGGMFELDASYVVGPYQLRLDGGDPIPDPRAEDVASVHGPCFLVDHSRFEWSDEKHQPGPLEGAVFYELHVGTFTPEGTFGAAARRFSELKALGVTHIELMPVATFAGKHGWGYDGTALFAPHRAYGGVDGLKRLVDTAHGLGLNVVLDVVYNHLGPIGNYLGKFGPYFHPDLHTPWGGAVVNLDGEGSSQVRRFILDNAFYWLRHYHFDGLRLDAVHALIDRSKEHVLAELAREVEAVGWPALIIAESDWNDPIVVRPRAEGGYGMDAQWSDDLHHALHATLTAERYGYYADFHPKPLRLIARALEQGFVYQGQPSGFRKGPHGKPLGAVPLQRLFGYAQTHDQVGNDATGRRLAHIAGLARAKAAMAVVMMSPFTPMLFMGEEWGASSPFLYFTDHPDPDVARATSEGRKRELVAKGFRAADVPDPQDAETFSRSRLDWAERESEPHAQMLRFTQALIELRRSSPELCSSVPGRCVVDEERKTLRYERGPFVLVLNLGTQTELSLPPGKSWRLLIETGASMASPNSVALGKDALAILGS
jgi:maltooligosyltrehalose trehalohydrolase